MNLRLCGPIHGLNVRPPVRSLGRDAMLLSARADVSVHGDHIFTCANIHTVDMGHAAGKCIPCHGHALGLSGREWVSRDLSGLVCGQSRLVSLANSYAKDAVPLL